MGKKYFIPLCFGCFLGVFMFCVLLRQKPKVEYDYPFYHNLEEMVSNSNQIVVGKVVADDGIQILDVGDGRKEYCVYRISVKDTIKGNAACGDEIFVRMFRLDDLDDHPFEVGSDYLCFLWDTDDFPAVLLNRDQSQIRLEGEDLLLTKNSYIAVKGSIENTRSASNIVIQEEAVNNAYEDIILRGAGQELLALVREIATQERK